MPSFAWDEGEGDPRSRRRLTTATSDDRLTPKGSNLHDYIAVVFERFEVVWPPDLADHA